MNFTAIDFETATGNRNSICSVGLVVVENCQIVDRISYLVKPPDNIYHPKNIEIHGITPEQTENLESFHSIYEKIKHLLEWRDVVAHNAIFEMDCLNKSLGGVPPIKWFCTYKIYKQKLSVLCQKYGIELNNHDALSDAEACAKLMIIDILRKN